MNDAIYRQAAIDLWDKYHYTIAVDAMRYDAELRQLPSAQPEVKKISYTDCANAMLTMWMDEVLTDGEYNRIMDKLNAHWAKGG